MAKAPRALAAPMLSLAMYAPGNTSIWGCGTFGNDIVQMKREYVEVESISSSWMIFGTYILVTNGRTRSFMRHIQNVAAACTKFHHAESP